MQCRATTRSGEPCKRAAAEGLEFCSWHLKVQAEREQQGGGFYVDVADEEGMASLAVASTMEGLDAEIAVLRVVIRWAIHHGQIDQARKAIGELGRLLKAQHDLSDQGAGKVTSALDRVLDAVGAELGVGL
jgi:hypothetical protein